jgi:hypothetical protein
MKKYICLILVAFQSSGYAQDTTKVFYTQEIDTLIKQRFIDRYENVFMTKEPTRHMFKLGVGQSSLSPSIYTSQVFLMNHEVGYEYKISKSFSAGVNASLDGSFYFSPSFLGTVSGNVYGRWYYDMKRRIKDGRSANNFSGNFVGIVAEKRLMYLPYKLPVNKTGIEFGMQRRFLNHGRLELAMGAYYQKSKAVTYNQPVFYGETAENPRTINASSDIMIATRSSLSMAFGDWKSTDNGSQCEILKCDQSVTQQWKVMWPSLGIGTKFVQATFGAGYERKLKQSPFSLNAQFVADYYSGSQSYVVNSEYYARRNFETNTSLQLRYYYLQKRKIRTGRGGNNLSGIYIGPQIDYYTSKSRSGSNLESNKHDIGFGLTFGFQKTLFNNFYIDVNASGGWEIFSAKDFRSNLRVGFGFRF